MKEYSEDEVIKEVECMRKIGSKGTLEVLASRKIKFGLEN